MKSKSNNQQSRQYDYIWPMAIIFIGFALRFYTFHHTYALNADGMLYIQQAKAFYHGLWDSLTECYAYLNIYPFFISLTYRVTDNWLEAAKLVSLFFGTATMLPLYLLLRKLFEVPLASCALLIFAVNPVFVEMSSEVIRGPAYWFCLTLGMYFFSLSEIDGKIHLLSLSSLSFIFACLSRFEAVIYLPVTIIFLLFACPEKKWRKILFFSAPLVLVAAMAVSTLSLMGHDLQKWLYPRSLWDKLLLVSKKYHYVRHGLEEIGSQQTLFWEKHFFPRVRNLLWLIGLGAVLVEIAKTFFEPFFLIFLLGLKGSWKRIKENKVLLYLSLLTVAAFILLNLHVHGHWIMRKRFVAILLLPSFFIVGFGLENIFSFIEKRVQIKKIYLVLLCCLLIFTIALPKNIQEKSDHRKVFQEIGEFIDTRSDGKHVVKVIGALEQYDLQLVNFFSNLSLKKTPCIRESTKQVEPSNYMRYAGKKHYSADYILWDSKRWPIDSLAQLREHKSINYEQIYEWHDNKFGKIILFQISARAD